MIQTEGRVVMVSGANRGIGRAVRARLLQAGYTVSAGMRHPAGLSEQDGLSVHAYEAATPDGARLWVEATMARHGRIDAVVNAAGFNANGRLLDTDETAFGLTWQINAMGPMRVIRAAWPYLIACGTGRVVNLSSLSGKRVRNDNLAYAMSKFALMALTQEVRRSGWVHGIRATAVCPGFVDTDMTAHVDSMARDAMSSPDDVAALIETVLALPNNAAIAELLVNCRHEDLL